MKTEHVILTAAAAGLGYLFWKKTQEGGGTPSDPVHPPIIPVPDPILPPPAVPVIPDPSYPPGSPENPLQPDNPLGPIIPIVDRYEAKQIATLVGWSKEELQARWTAFYQSHFVDHIRKYGDLTWQELYAFDTYQDINIAKQVAAQATLLRSLGWKNIYRQITSGGASAAWGEWWVPSGWPEAWQTPILANCQILKAGDPYTGGVYEWVKTSIGEQYNEVFNTAWLELSAHEWNGTAWVRGAGCPSSPPPGGGGTNPPPAGPVTVSGLRVSPAAAYIGDSVTVSFEVTNPNAAQQAFSVPFSGFTSATITGTLLTYETRTVSFSVPVTWTGSRTASAAGATVSVTGVQQSQPPPPCQPTSQPAPWHDTANRRYVPYQWDQAICAWVLNYAGAYDDGTTPPPDEPPFSYADLPQPYSNCSQRQHDAAVYFGRTYNYYAGGSSCQSGIPPVNAYIVVSCSGGGL